MARRKKPVNSDTLVGKHPPIAWEFVKNAINNISKAGEEGV
jgi:hypothetical protein